MTPVKGFGNNIAAGDGMRVHVIRPKKSLPSSTMVTGSKKAQSTGTTAAHVVIKNRGSSCQLSAVATGEEEQLATLTALDIKDVKESTKEFYAKIEKTDV